MALNGPVRNGVSWRSLNLAILAVSLLVLCRIASNRAFAKKRSEKVRATLRKELHFERVHIEEVMRQSDGYIVASVLVGKESKIKGF